MRLNRSAVRHVMLALLAVTWSGAQFVASQSAAAQISVLSAGAIEPGILAAADMFRKSSGKAVAVRFATAPMIIKAISGDEAADVVIAPPAVLETLVKAGKLQAQGHVGVGKVGVGVAVKTGAPVPDIATSDAVKAAVLAAESVVYNQASTGLYMDQLIARWGLAETLKARTTRYPNGEAVMEHLLKGRAREIGFGAQTEILLYKPKGLSLVGPLPADIQNTTSYAATVHAGAANAAGAKDFLTFLGTPEAKRAFVERGIE